MSNALKEQRRLLKPIALSMNEAAAELGICRSTLRKLVKTNQISFTPVGRRVLFSPQNLQEFMSNGERFREDKRFKKENTI